MVDLVINYSEIEPDSTWITGNLAADQTSLQAHYLAHGLANSLPRVLAFYERYSLPLPTPNLLELSLLKAAQKNAQLTQAQRDEVAQRLDGQGY